MTTHEDTDGWLLAGSVDEIARRGVVVVHSARHGIAVFVQGDVPRRRVAAVDNRCPHMGFPLSRGSICDGILTCHWHHARFDLATGGTFDPFADDVAVHRVAVVDGVVWVDPRPVPIGDRAARWAARLEDALEQDLSLVLVKSVLGLLSESGASASRGILEIGAGFGARQRAAGWGPGLTILTAMGRCLDRLAPDDRPIALFHGLAHVAADCAGAAPRFRIEPLPGSGHDAAWLRRQFRQFAEMRNAEGVERALATAIAAGLPSAAVADLILAAVTDHYFVNGGHTLDFTNKAFELLALIGWEHAADVLPSLVGGLARATRSEEQSAWRSPIDLVALAAPSLDRLPEAVRLDSGSDWLGFETFTQAALSDDPAAIVAAIDQAWDDGAAPAAVTLALAYAAALRVARFPISNEFGDWIAVLHTLTYCNALHQSMKRAPSIELCRGIYHGALKVYVDRFLNVPSARLPDGNGQTIAPEALAAELASLLDRQQQVTPAADLVDGYLRGEGPATPLWAALGNALLREDAEFHSYQMYEAGAALFDELAPTRPDAARNVAVATARYLAAHAPTHREMRQTARIAVRLQRGDDLTAEDE
ncbi:MAG: Rieske (2Fe-2S) protein [Chloroflexota bacterium]|nr:MAG: Rieske (2Fe-2S) protein [Chloroflexota bacterium]